MIDENTRKKIQKLFTMAEKGEGNEAEIALKKANLLLREYGITQDDVNLFIEKIPCTKRKERWISHLHELCCTFCGIVSLVGYNDLCFAGDESGKTVECLDFGFIPMAMLYRDNSNYDKRSPEWARFQTMWARPTIIWSRYRKHWEKEVKYGF